MGIFVSETCWGNKITYFVASSWFFTLHYVYGARSHGHQISHNIVYELETPNRYTWNLFSVRPSYDKSYFLHTVAFNIITDILDD
jgi:hypothetical protein